MGEKSIRQGKRCPSDALIGPFDDSFLTGPGIGCWSALWQDLRVKALNRDPRILRVRARRAIEQWVPNRASERRERASRPRLDLARCGFAEASRAWERARGLGTKSADQNKW